ncbi:MAG: hypothetical protein NY202_03785 [Mollicutes bacterium UO1]
MKRYNGGKGEGMYVGKESDPAELGEIFKEQEQFYLAQPYIEQQLFKILSDSDGKCSHQDMRLVGMIPSFNRNLLGLGLFRGSRGNIVNVSRHGGEILTPLFEMKKSAKKSSILAKLNSILTLAKERSPYYCQAIPIN